MREEYIFNKKEMAFVTWQILMSSLLIIELDYQMVLSMIYNLKSFHFQNSTQSLMHMSGSVSEIYDLEIFLFFIKTYASVH